MIPTLGLYWNIGIFVCQVRRIKPERRPYTVDSMKGKPRDIIYMDLPVFMAAIIFSPDYIEKYVNQGKERRNITFLLSPDQKFIDYLKLKYIGLFLILFDGISRKASYFFFN